MGGRKHDPPPAPHPVTLEVAGNERAILVYELLDPIIQNNILCMERAGALLAEMLPVVQDQFRHYVAGLKDQRKRLRATADDPKASDKERDAARKALHNATRWMDQVSRALQATSRVTDEQVRLRQFAAGEPESRRELRLEHAEMGETALMAELVAAVLALDLVCPSCHARLARYGGTHDASRAPLPVSRALPPPNGDAPGA
jgi:hypothetical protein